MDKTVHNPDRYMSDLRQIISQGQKRIGFLIGAGAPMSIRINQKTKLIDPDGIPLIPGIVPLTKAVFESIEKKHKGFIDKIKKEMGEDVNIELALSRIRMLSSAIGSAEVFGYNAEKYKELADDICAAIAGIVNRSLPEGETPYRKLVSWVPLLVTVVSPSIVFCVPALTLATLLSS